MPSEEDKVQITFADNTVFTLHCTTDINPDYSSDVTEHYVEDDSDIADNINTHHPALTIVASMSELEGQTGPYDPYFVGDHIAFDKKMVSAWEAEEVLHIDTKIRGIFFPMAILNYSPSSTAMIGKSLDFTLSLRRLSYAETKTRNLKQERIDAENKAAVKKRRELGLKTPVRANDRLAAQTQAATAFGDVDPAAVFEGG